MDNHLKALECLDAGATDCIYKPVSIPELLTKVNAFEHGLVLPINQHLEINTLQNTLIIVNIFSFIFEIWIRGNVEIT
jgi:DNA-binding response OmpR family regulator